MSKRADIFHFLRNLCILAIILFICDRIIGLGLNKLYFSLKKGQYSQMTYSIDSIKNTGVLIFGSSRAIRHYSPQVITSLTGETTYNMGKDGQFVPFYSALQEAALKKNIPKIIIVDMNIWEFTMNMEKYEKLSALLPYALNHPEFIPYIDEISRWEKLKLFSRTYPYNSTLIIAAHDYLKSNSLPAYSSGYLPLEWKMTKEHFEDYRVSKGIFDAKRAGKDVPIDLKALKYYEAFLDRTKKYNIKTFVIISPTILKEVDTREKKLIKTIAAKYPNVVFKDFSQDSTYNNQYTKFADIFHLNTQGAVEFSTSVAGLISPSLSRLKN